MNVLRPGVTVFWVVLTSSVMLADESSRQPIDLLIVAGQSNAVGFDANPADLPQDDADGHILFWWRCGDPPPDEHDSSSERKWTALQPQPLGNPITPRSGRQYGNYAQPEGGFGPEMSLARTLYAAERRPLAVLKVAFSGTSMKTDWDPHGTGVEGACYRALLTEFRAAQKSAATGGWDLKPRAFIWVQGESDANEMDAPKYADGLGGMISQLRKDVAVADLPALIAVNTRFSKGANPHVATIVKQQQLLARRHSLIHYVDTSSATIANYAHYDAAGTLLVGRLFAESLRSIEGTSARVKSPRQDRD